tara:strand:- start:2356 stop:2628 length:273 start_codon:yes stop_codon:yes gene_type:complete
MVYIRYEFNTKGQLDAKVANAKEDEIKGDFIALPKFIETQGQYDDNGVEIVAPILSNKFAVDVRWYELDASPYGWKTYEVTPDNPRHSLL